MGRGWVKVRDGVRQGILRANDVEARDVVERWEQFIDYVALGLSQDLGRDVSPVRPKNSRWLSGAMRISSAWLVMACSRGSACPRRSWDDHA